MGVLSFIKNAGSKLFGLGVSDDEKATKIIAHLQSFELDTTNLTVAVADEVVTLGGSVDTIFQKIRVVATAGNIDGISSVNDDNLAVGEPVEINVAPEEQFHTVVSGDTLSGISKKFYGNANLYNKIFEANKPMLSNPDKIYPGQMLVIPQEN
jgi:nucleoid-associated protein YgaU